MDWFKSVRVIELEIQWKQNRSNGNDSNGNDWGDNKKILIDINEIWFSDISLK